MLDSWHLFIFLLSPFLSALSPQLSGVELEFEVRKTYNTYLLGEYCASGSNFVM